MFLIWRKCVYTLLLKQKRIGLILSRDVSTKQWGSFYCRNFDFKLYGWFWSKKKSIWVIHRRNHITSFHFYKTSSQITLLIWLQYVLFETMSSRFSGLKDCSKWHRETAWSQVLYYSYNHWKLVAILNSYIKNEII